MCTHVCKTASTSLMTHCTLTHMSCQYATHMMQGDAMMQCSGQFTREAHLVHFELDPDWMVSQAVRKLRRLLYHYSNHWSHNSWSIFSLHTAHIIGRIRKWSNTFQYWLYCLPMSHIFYYTHVTLVWAHFNIILYIVYYVILYYIFYTIVGIVWSIFCLAWTYTL